MKKRLFYYGHKYGGKPENLERAQMRFDLLVWSWRTRYPDRLLWAPWFAMAEAGVAESGAWCVIYPALFASAGAVLDLDGEPLSPGMCEEENKMLEIDGEIVKVDGEDFEEVKP